ncbi:MAG TPA: extracellular solute-binding protein [Azospira sp.]|nr:extracellular solute-binding protein [Azospira sp.]
MSTEKVSISRRTFLKLTGSMMAGAALAACTPKLPTVARPTSAPVQLVYQDWRTEWFPGMAQTMLEEFHQQHPNISVFFTQDPDNLAEQMVSDMTAGTAPDVFDGCCEFFPAWADAGYLMDLRPYVKADLDKATISEWSPAQYQALFSRDGKQFGLPKYHGALVVYYNKDLFDAVGAEYPSDGWNYSDYLVAMQKLTVRSGKQVVQWGSMFDVAWERIQMHVNGWGGHYVGEGNPVTCQMADKYSMNALEWLRQRIWDDHVMASFIDVQNLETRWAFINQKIAMVEDGSWALKDILENAKFRIGVVTFPTGPLRHVTLATTDGFGISSRTKNPDAAWELLKFLISKDYGRAMARTNLLQPARSSLIPEWIDYIKKAYPQPTKDMNLDAFADGQIKGYSVTNEIFPNMVGVGEIAKDAWDRIYTLGKAPVTIMADVCTKIDAIQKGKAGIPISCGCQAPA